MTRQVFVVGSLGRGSVGASSLGLSGLGQGGTGVGVARTGFDSTRDSASIRGDSLAGLSSGDEVELAGEEAHHAAVKRLRLGEVVDLVDGHGSRATGEVVRLGKTIRIRLLDAAQLEAEPALRLTLIQALAKEKRDMQALESACEIGATRVVPWGAARSVSRWDTVPKRAKGREKWRNLALSAMKQSRQSRLAEIGEYVESGVDVARGYNADSPDNRPDSKTVFSEVERIIARGGVVFVLHESATEKLSSLLQDLVFDSATPPSQPLPPVPVRSLSNAAQGVQQQLPTEIAVVVGPEGGITEAELAGFETVGVRVALLGPTVLRCSTAGPAALAVIQATLGSWR